MMTRKQFLRSALELSAATLGLTVLASCTGGPRAPAPDAGAGGTDAGNPTVTPKCVQDGTSVAIGDNHGHVMVVTKDDVMTGQQKTYDIQGTSDHDHTVVLTAADFAQLAADQVIMTTSSYDADHSHAIMVACA